MAYRYTTSKLNFVEVDVQEFENIARLCKVSVSGFAGNLPALILFEDGKEVLRFPVNDTDKSSYTTLNYKEKELVKYFDLDKRHLATRDIGVEKKKAAT